MRGALDRKVEHEGLAQALPVHSRMTTAFKDTLPQELVTHVTAICGSRGEDWFQELLGTILDLEQQWSVKVGQPFPGIEFNFVAEATMKGRPVVLKVAPPFERPEIHAEAEYLRNRNGNGAVELIAHDRERRALLIERALPGEALFKVFESDPFLIIQPAVNVLKSILRPPPSDMSDVGSLDAWVTNFRRYRDTDFPASYAEKAFEIYERLSKQPGRRFYLHGDFHPGNIVTATRVPYLAIDPKGIVGHVGYDIAVFLNNLHWWRRNDRSVADLLDQAISQFAEAFDLTKTEVREWAFVYMVIGAWWTFDEMPGHYDSDLAELDVWDV